MGEREGVGCRCVPPGTHANYTPLRRGRQQISERERRSGSAGVEKGKGVPGEREDGTAREPTRNNLR